MTTVLFVCLQNAGRSRMSEALFTPCGRGAGATVAAVAIHAARG